MTSDWKVEALVILGIISAMVFAGASMFYDEVLDTKVEKQCSPTNQYVIVSGKARRVYDCPDDFTSDNSSVE